MKYLLGILYILFFSWLANRLPFLKNSGLSKGQTTLFFGLKILFGLTYGYIFLRQFSGGDPYLVFRGGDVIWSSFFENPLYYLRLVFGPNGGFIDPVLYKYAYEMNYWDHAGFYNIARFHALIRPITFGYYSVHIIFMAFLMLIAGVYFYRGLSEIPNAPKVPLMILIFCHPVLLFWTGGIHKEGFVYLGLGMAFYHALKFEGRWKSKDLIFFLAGLGIIGLMRPYLLAILIPLFILLFYFLRKPVKSVFKFPLAYAGFAAILLLISKFIPGVDFFRRLAERQESFLAESGGSDFPITLLEPNILGFLTSIPNSLFQVFTRPYLWISNHVLISLSAVGILIFWIFAFSAIPFRKKEIRVHPALMFLFLFSITYLLLIGMLVSNMGTLVRYRSLPIHFLLIILIFLIDWEKLKGWFSRLLKNRPA